jgi:hypothetical protein
MFFKTTIFPDVKMVSVEHRFTGRLFDQNACWPKFIWINSILSQVHWTKINQINLFEWKDLGTFRLQGLYPKYLKNSKIQNYKRSKLSMLRKRLEKCVKIWTQSKCSANLNTKMPFLNINHLFQAIFFIMSHFGTCRRIRVFRILSKWT